MAEEYLFISNVGIEEYFFFLKSIFYMKHPTGKALTSNWLFCNFLIDNHYKTLYSPARPQCSSCGVWNKPFFIKPLLNLLSVCSSFSERSPRGTRGPQETPIHGTLQGRGTRIDWYLDFLLAQPATPLSGHLSTAIHSLLIVVKVMFLSTCRI